MPEKSRNHRLQGVGQPPPRTTYTWWIHPKKTTATMKIQSRINLLRYSQRADISGGSLSHAIVNTATLSQEKTILWMMPKTMKTPLSQPPNRTNGKIGESAPTNRP